MDYKPLYDKVLVKEVKDSPLQGGIVAHRIQSGLKKGLVVSVGNGLKDSPMIVQVGQTVLFKPIDAEDIILEDVQYKLLQERNVWMVTKNEKQ